MKNDFPIYHLLCQEIKACAEHLLEICRNQHFNASTDSNHIIDRLHDLHQLSQKICIEDHYHPLSDLKHYLEHTMLPYPDNNNSIHTMRLSEAISLLKRHQTEVNHFDPLIARSLHERCIDHCRKELKSGRRLHQTLQEIKDI